MGYFNTVVSFLQNLYSIEVPALSWLGGSTTVGNWVLILLGVLIISQAWTLYRWYQSRTYLGWKSFPFEGLLFKWEWKRPIPDGWWSFFFREPHKIDNLRVICPNCKRVGVIDENTFYKANSEFFFRCKKCPSIKIKTISPGALEYQTKNEIDHHIENGTWKQFQKKPADQPPD